MNDHSKVRISYQEAARLIYGTGDPSIIEVNKIDYKVASGTLQGNREDQWVHSESLASYIAVKDELRKQKRGKRATQTGGSENKSHKQLSPIYRGLIREYVAAVLRRRSLSNASAAFSGAVLTGQFVLILIPIIGLIMSFRALGPPPEQAAIEEWLKREVGEYQVVEWFPNEPVGESRIRVRLKYKYYTHGRKKILTDRVFIVDDGVVTSVNQTSDEFDY